jgi:hypothetical protein
MQKPLSFLQSVLLIASIGILTAFIWDEASIRLFILAPLLIPFGISAQTLVYASQIGAAIFTLIAGPLSAYAVYWILKRFQIVRTGEVFLLSAFLWGFTLYAEEISSSKKSILSAITPPQGLAAAVPSDPINTLLLLIIARYIVDLISILLFWYVLRRKLGKSSASVEATGGEVH